MSFGFSVGDFIQGIKVSKSVYEAIREGTKEYKELKGDVKAMQFVLESLSRDTFDANSLLAKKGASRKDQLIRIVNNSEGTMLELQSLVDKHSRIEYSSGKLKRVWHT